MAVLVLPGDFTHTKDSPSPGAPWVGLPEACVLRGGAPPGRPRRRSGVPDRWPRHPRPAACSAAPCACCHGVLAVGSLGWLRPGHGSSRRPRGSGGRAPPVSARMSAAASALELWAVWGRHPLFGAAALPADRGVGPSEDARQLLGAAGQPSDTPTFRSLRVPAWRAQHQKFPVWPRVTPGEAGPLFSPLAPGGATGRL